MFVVLHHSNLLRHSKCLVDLAQLLVTTDIRRTISDSDLTDQLAQLQEPLTRVSMLIGTSIGTIGAIATSKNVPIDACDVPIGEVYSLFGRSKAVTNGACFPNTLNNARLN